MQDQNLSKSIDTVSHRDSASLTRGLTAWLEEHRPGTRLLRLSAPEGSGASSELFFMDVEDEGEPARWVARLQSAYPVYPYVDLAQQAHCMAAAAQHSKAPVPMVHGVETRALPGIEAPFLLMEARQGLPAPDIPSYVTHGWLFEAGEEQQRTVWNNGVRAIAALHDTDLAAADPIPSALPTPGDTALERMLVYWEDFLALVSEDGDFPALQDSVKWLRNEAPADLEDSGLVWGDASLRNMLFAGLAPCALLDFEFAHVGIRSFDIVFYAWMDYVMAEGFAGGVPRLPGFPGVRETLELYEELSGRPVRHRDYLMRMAVTYTAVSTTRVFLRMASQGKVSTADVATNIPLVMLGEYNSGRALPA